MKWTRRLQYLLYVLASVPFVGLVVGLLSDDLGANPVETITHVSGEWGLRLLIACLAITPLRKLTGVNSLVLWRRPLGLFAFFYVSLHLLTYVVLDAGLDLAYIFEDIRDRLYITAGFVAFCLMIPLAATSTNNMIRRLGGKRWLKLHRLTYVAAVASVLHFIWLVKADLREPLVYLGILVILFVARAQKNKIRRSSKQAADSTTASAS